METKFTPGPWEDVWLDDENGWIKDSRGNYLAEMVTKDEAGLCVPKDEAEANAHLLAAAPELLEACRLALDYFNYTRSGREWRDSGGEETAKLLEAINKATGGA